MAKLFRLRSEVLRTNLAQLAAGAPEIAKAALQAGADVLAAGMRRRAGDPTIANSIATELVQTRAGALRARIGPVRGLKTGRHRMFAASLAYWREFGTRHKKPVKAGAFTRVRISRRKGGGTRPKSEKRALAGPGFGPVTSVQIPPIPARPFLRPTLEQDGQKAAEAMGAALWSRLTQRIRT